MIYQSWDIDETEFNKNSKKDKENVKMRKEKTAHVTMKENTKLKERLLSINSVEKLLDLGGEEITGIVESYDGSVSSMHFFNSISILDEEDGNTSIMVEYIDEDLSLATTGIVISEVEKIESTLNDEAEQFVNILLTNEDGKQVIILVDYTEISMQTGNIKETVRI